MKGLQIALDILSGRKAAALVLDGILDDFLVDPPDGIVRAGSVVRGRIGRPVKGMGGAFVDLGGATGFLKQAQGRTSGSMVTVQVTGYSEPGKALPLTSRVLIKSRYCIATPGAPGLNISRSIADDAERVRLREVLAELEIPDNVGLILRTSCRDAPDQIIAEDVTQAVTLATQIATDATDAPTLLLDGPDAHELAWRDWPEVARADVLDAQGAFDTLDMSENISNLLRPAVQLGSGAGLYVEPTRAVVAIDINTGPSMQAAAGLKTNIAAAREIPRSLRLRGLGGQIAIDFAPMAKKDRKQVESALRAAFRADPVETALVGWTTMGLFELQRKRERLPVVESLQ